MKVAVAVHGCNIHSPVDSSLDHSLIVVDVNDLSYIVVTEPRTSVLGRDMSFTSSIVQECVENLIMDDPAPELVAAIEKHGFRVYCGATGPANEAVYRFLAGRLGPCSS